MDAALEALDDCMRITKAARIWDWIPRQTLTDCWNGKYKTNIAGRTTKLKTEEEHCIVRYIKYIASISQPLTIAAIKVFAGVMSRRNNGPSGFNKDTGPGHTWWWSFRIRHCHEITLRQPDHLDRGHARIANCHVMKNHFDKLEAVSKEHNLQNKPSQIFNCDEAGFRADS